MLETTKKEKTRLLPTPFRKTLCRVGIHKWSGIYTKYSFDSNYRIDWDQYCLYCPAERENPIHAR